MRVSLTYMSIDCGRQHTWKRCEHANCIQKELGPGIEPKFFLMWHSNIKNWTTKPPTIKNCCIISFTVKDLISIHFYWHRRRHAPTRLQLQLCNMQFHTPFTVTEWPWTNRLPPQCSTDWPEAGGVTHHWVSLWPHDCIRITDSASTCISRAVNLWEVCISVCPAFSQCCQGKTRKAN